jgi:pimeloyl-ACP methyl ester carboxylesterase
MSQLTTPSQSNVTAPNQSIEADNGVTFAYRRFGNADGAALPLVCFQRYRGNLDNWDPALVDAIAVGREVILFDNAGVGGSTGAVPRTVTPMAYEPWPSSRRWASSRSTSSGTRWAASSRRSSR